MTHILKPSAFNRIILLFVLGVSTIGWSSCDDPALFNFKTERSDIHYNLDKIDTFNVFLKTIREDSLRAENFTRDLLGSYYDPVFGLTNASIYTEIRLPKKIVSYGTNRVFDSLVLHLKYSYNNNYFGWLDDEISFEVYELKQRIYLDTPYYSSTNILFDPTPIGSFSGKVVPNGKNVIKVKLSESLGNKILNASNEELGDDTKFKNILKGLAIIPKSTNKTGVIVTLNLENDTSGLSLYFHNDSGAFISKFQINDKCARVSKFSHSYNNSLVLDQLNNPSKYFEQVYVQPLAGLKANVDIPDLKKLATLGPIAINRAELILHQSPVFPYLDYQIPSLILLVTDSSNVNYSIIDRYEDYYGGKYNKNNQNYSFIITRYIQDIVDNYRENQNFKSKYKLNLIIPSDNPILATPLILSNIDKIGNTVTELKIYYTKLK